MPRQRQLYQSDLVYVGPTGFQGAILPGTGQLNTSGAGQYGNYLAQIASGGINLISELFRVTKVDDSWSRKLTNVNQIGSLAAIDRVTIDQPTVNISLSWNQNNLVNEGLIGLTVAKSGSPQLVTCISGMLSQFSEPLNYFIKTSSEGQDAIGDTANNYFVTSFGNCYLDTYTAQGSVGNFPTVDATFRALNAQVQQVNTGVGAMTPAVTIGSGTNITGWAYVLPTGVSSFNNVGVGLGNYQGISSLRPGDIQFNFGLNPGDGFASPPDIKVQSYSLSIPLNREDLLKLGSKYAYAILPKFPIDVTLTIDALMGDFQTGSLVEIINNNNSFNPSITINLPGTQTPIVNYQLNNAKLQDNTFSQSTSSTAKTMRFSFVTQIGGPQDIINGVFMSGITVS